MRMLNFVLGVFLVIGIRQVSAQANGTSQKDSPRESGPSQAVLGLWNDVGRKLIAMAEDLPEEKYQFRPNPAQRTFAEQLLHVAGSNELFTAVAKGQRAIDDESPAHYPTKSAVVEYLKRSFALGAEVLKERGDKGMAEAVRDSESGQMMSLTALAYELIEHSGEHYGQLIVYYRSLGLVPPESRPKK